MLAEMDQRTFDSLPDAELWLVCSEPAVRRIRAGTSGERARMLSGLGAGERALFGFRLLTLPFVRKPTSKPG
ncbi:hypothetical protein [Cohnella zeiphila]|nr:hypothetical protein [Cohnella zeiphila]